METINKAQHRYAHNIIKGKVPECELPRTLETAQSYLADENQKAELRHQASVAKRDVLKQFLQELLTNGQMSQEDYDNLARFF
jgi:hypothetical protein